jgi:hypothetical protein
LPFWGVELCFLHLARPPGSATVQSRDFCFWLQGFFELSGDATVSASQATVISRHLELVFRHEIAPLAKAKPAPDAPRPEPAPPPPAPDARPTPERSEPMSAPVPTPRC